MSLKKQDLQSIEEIFDRKNSALSKELKTAIDRSESRVVSAMGLLQRDTFDRFEDHEKRIARLEKLAD